METNWSIKTVELPDRSQRAARIIASPSLYKVCEGCESIVGEHVVTCPNCHGYRFDASSQAVVHQAIILANREQRSVTAQDLVS